MKRKIYSSDLSDAEWSMIEALVPAPLPGGRPAQWPRREIVNGGYCMCCEPVANGIYYRMIFRRTKRFMITIGSGAARDCGNGSTQFYVNASGSR